MKYGIRNGCLPGTWEEAFASATDLGFDGVELDVGADYREGLLWTAAGRRQVAEWAGRGAELSSTCIGGLWTHSFASSDPAVRDRAREATLNTIEANAELGARWILLPITPGGDDVDSETGRERWIEGVSACAAAAAEHKVELALENVGRGYGQSAVDLLAIAQAVDSPWVRTYYDYGNGLSLGNDPIAELNLLGTEWITILHAKDPGGPYLGEGNVDHEAVVSTVRQIGYDGYIVLETPSTDDPPEAARRNLAFLRENFG